MCLAIPAEVKKIKGEYALVDFGGLQKDVKIVLTPEVKVGDYVIVHAGFSIYEMDKEEARESLELWKEILSTT
ncbi:MAG: HypC/HybG/HupF family hydrogenase formation chaperone [Dehalococcoidia bacterium]